MIQGKIISYEDGLSEAFEIRNKVFVGENGIPKELEFDDLDKDSMHVIVYEADPNGRNNQRKVINTKAVATGRIIYDGFSCQIGKIAVLKEYRGNRYGDFTVRMLLNKAFTAGIEEVTIHAFLSSEGFYNKIGFKKIGDKFIENGIWHCKMYITAQNIVTICGKN